MSDTKVSYLSKKWLDILYKTINDNLERYRSGDFEDLISQGGWNIELSINYDPEPLSQLDPSGGPENEIENSLLVWKSLYNLTPALACEDRIWTRLTHAECLEYSRNRWLDPENSNDEKLAKSVRSHLFAPSLTACRDDHSIARLWWNAKIAKGLRPHDQKGALKLMLKTADIRSNLVERSWLGSRQQIAQAILRIMDREPWVTQTESNYREFMKTVNHRGGGKVFELLPDSEIDRYMDNCFLLAHDR